MAAARAAETNPPSDHARTAPRGRERESRRQHPARARVRILHHTSDHGSHGGAADPEHVEQKAGPDEDQPLECPSPPRERPRLVDDRLGLHEPAKRSPDATVTLIATYRAFRNTAARIAAVTVPPASRTDTAANCADLSERRRRHDDRNGLNPAALGQDLNDNPKSAGLGARGIATRIPSRNTRRASGSAGHEATPSRRSRCDNPFA